MAVDLQTEKPVIFVIDDDQAVRESTDSLLRSVGLAVLSFDSPREFLRIERPDAPGCLILDVRMPGLSGLEFYRELSEGGVSLPVIFITAYADVPMSVRAMKAGAIEFLTKPFRHQDLLDAIQLGVERNRQQRLRIVVAEDLRRRFEALSSREREVILRVLNGRSTKQIAEEFGLSESTVKVHRSRAMQKIQVKSPAELGRLAEKFGMAPFERASSVGSLAGHTKA